MESKIREALDYQIEVAFNLEASIRNGTATPFHMRKGMKFPASDLKERLTRKAETYKFCITLPSKLIFPHKEPVKDLDFLTIPHPSRKTTHWLFPTFEEMQRFLFLTKDILKE